ncbi:MAG: hypothetical protein IKQ97_01405 [Eubacterium sp.]|nr:hypothetical protein [Eubacterium sp.]
MAHTNCPNGHDMWNGDGKPIVQAFRLNYFKEFTERHPDFKLQTDEYQNLAIYDTYDYDDHPEEEYDLWYCDKCKGLVVFTYDNRMRYDYVYSESAPNDLEFDTTIWEEYYALRDDEFFDEFIDLCEKKTPWEVLTTYKFRKKYRLSPDKKTIFAYEAEENRLEFVYRQIKIYHFDEN